MSVKVAGGEAVLELPKAVYDRSAAEVAATVLAARAEAFLEPDGSDLRITLKPLRAATNQDLERLAGEFLNEMLNQQYRAVVSRFNAKATQSVVTQALYAARPRPARRDPERDPKYAAEVAALMRDAEKEIRDTMPKKIAPQGAPIPPEAGR